MNNSLPFGHFFPAFLFVIVIIAIFEAWMIVHAIRNEHIDSNRKVLWVIGMLLLHPFVAIAYYFTDYKLDN